MEIEQENLKFFKLEVTTVHVLLRHILLGEDRLRHL